MKKVLRGLSTCIALVSIVWSLNSSASVAFEVKGKIDAITLLRNSGELKLISKNEEFILSNVNVSELNCLEGNFVIVNNIAPANTFSIVETISCQKELKNTESLRKSFNKDFNGSCPEIYQPVCGQPVMPICPPGQFCTMQMPSPKTYSNICELKIANAVLLFKGECEIFERAERMSTLPIALRLNERKI